MDSFAKDIVVSFAKVCVEFMGEKVEFMG
jgi:hypothetical protein